MSPQRNRTVLLTAMIAFVLGALPALGSDVTGLRADLVADIDQLEQKIVGLAEEIPAESFSWRPAEGVRSVSEAMMHAAQANFFFPTMVGQDPPEGVPMGQLEQITDKAEVIEMTKKSFGHLKQMVESTPDDRMGETINLFGRETTLAGMMHVATAHCHEHLGQLIAYARANGITPPWSQ